MTGQSKFYRFFKAFLRATFKPLFRIKVIHAERFNPEDNGGVLYSNHHSNWDPFAAHIATEYRPQFMAKAELFKVAPVRGFITYFGAFPVERGKGDFAAFQSAFKVVENGGIVGIYPEGTRNKKGLEVKKFHTGAAIIAIKTGVKVYPLYYSNKLRPFRRTYMVYGEPIDIKEQFGEVSLADRDKVREVSEYMREAVIKLKDEVPV